MKGITHRQKDGTTHDRYTFADNVTGLLHAWETTLSKRRAGLKTYLELSHVANTDLATVVAVPPKRPNRKERGAIL